jgi:sortase A
MTSGTEGARRFTFAPPRAPGKPPSAPSWFSSKVKPRLAAGGPPTITSMTTTWALALLALVTLWFVFFATVMSSLQQAHSQHNAYTLFREELTQLSHRTAPLGGTIKPDAPVALINAPSIKLKDVVVVEGTASGDLMRGPGHRRNSPLPGQIGTSVLLGRANLFGGPFGGLAKAKPGNIITVTTGQGEAKYKVEGLRRAGDPYPVILGSGEGRLTLISSEGGSWTNCWTPKRIVYLDAKLQGTAFPVPPGRPLTVPKSENNMKGDIGALFPLVLWLPLLIFALLAIVWALDRWGRWQTWLVGAPVLLAAIWGVSETAVQLLPNLT